MARGIWVTIKSDKYKPRTDLKEPWWFKCSNRLLEDEDLYDLTLEEICVWIHVMSLSSLKKSNTVFINFEAAERKSRLKEKLILSALAKLNGKQLDAGDVQDANICRTDAVQMTSGREEKRREEERREEYIAQSGDFADFWSGVPRKVGKGKAAKAYWKLIKSGVSHQELCTARDAYKSFCQKNGTEARFIKHGSTFLNEYLDWLDPETGQSENFSAQASQPNWAKIFNEPGGVA